jgi:hypothetical protein
MQVDPIKPALEAPGTKRLKPKCDQPPSTFAFNFNLRRYIVKAFGANEVHAFEAGAYTRSHFSST